MHASPRPASLLPRLSPCRASASRHCAAQHASPAALRLPSPLWRFRAAADAHRRERMVDMDTSLGTVTLHALGPRASTEPPKNFTFDQVYDENSSQEFIFNQTAAHIVDSVLDGFNGTIFAYGQTGTGKTFTMEGVNEPVTLCT